MRGNIHQGHKKAILGAVLGFVIVTAAVVAAVANHTQPNIQNKATSVAVQKQPVAAGSLTSSMMFVGEVFWGRGIEYFANRSPLKTEFPFSGLTTELHSKYNNWIGDMECPVTTTDIPYQTQVDHLQFNCRPEYLQQAKKWFDAFTIANNHECDNRGEVGHQETQANLQAAGIQYFGDCYPTNTDDICEVVAMNATADKKAVKIPVAMCGYMYVVDVAPSQAELAVMAKYAAVMPVIAMPHMGVEYRGIAEEAKVEAYHRMIDAGADVVLGAHPHVIQNSENYKGKLIQYSPGNFMFDQQSLGRDNILSLGIGISLEINDKAAIAAYQSVGSECKAFKDSCLEKLAAKIKTRPAIKVKYNPECFMEPKYYPMPADAETCDEILKQATWQSAAAGLKTTW